MEVSVGGIGCLTNGFIRQDGSPAGDQITLLLPFSYLIVSHHITIICCHIIILSYRIIILSWHIFIISILSSSLAVEDQITLLSYHVLSYHIIFGHAINMCSYVTMCERHSSVIIAGLGTQIYHHQKVLHRSETLKECKFHH